MFSVQNQFAANLNRVKDIGVLARSLEAMTTSAIDVSDLRRAQIVLGVSAFDHLVHELARVGMIEIAEGHRPTTEAYDRFQIPAHAVTLARAGVPANDWLGENVRRKHSWQSFQEPDKVADAIRLISEVKLWEEIGRQLSKTPKELKTTLKLVCERRNKIAHEADMDPTNPAYRWPIDDSMVQDAIGFLEQIGNTIYEIVRLP